MGFCLNYKSKKLIGIRTLKTGLGAALAISMAQVLGLKYALSAGIITILSIQSTKRQSIEVAIRRFLATCIALGISTLLFSILGYHPGIFGLYLILFIPIATGLGLEEGIVMASVLVTHLISEQTVSVSILINELLLVIVGAGIALILNLYMPSVEKELECYRAEIEEHMMKLFMHLAKSLRAQAVSIEEEVLFTQLTTQIKEAQSKAYKHANNYLIATVSPYEKYFLMRSRQLRVMNDMRDHFRRFFMTVDETEIVAQFAEKVASSLKGMVKVDALLEELEDLRVYFKASKLPETREEFENRAMLYQFLNDLENFLEIKKEFKQSLTQKELEEYEKGYVKA